MVFNGAAVFIFWMYNFGCTSAHKSVIGTCLVYSRVFQSVLCICQCVSRCSHQDPLCVFLQVVAIKKFKESEEDEAVRKTTLREVKILRLISKHANIVHPLPWVLFIAALYTSESCLYTALENTSRRSKIHHGKVHNEPKYNF